MEGAIHPLKKSPSQTMLQNYMEELGSSNAANVGDTAMNFNGAEDGTMDKHFETLYQSDDSTGLRPMSAVVDEFCGPYPKGKLFNPIFEMMEAEQSLKRWSEENVIEDEKQKEQEYYEDIEKVTEYDDDEEIFPPLTMKQAKGYAEEIISEMEQDLVEVLKFRGIHPYTTSEDSVDGHY
jgi:hypothetical protein